MVRMETGQQFRREASRPISNGACPDCGAQAVQIMQEEAAFHAVCSDCAHRGPAQHNVYEALMDWRRRTGVPAPSMARSLLHILIGLAVSAAAIGTASLIFE